MQMTPLSIPVLISLFFFEKVESAGELELDLRSIVEWGDRWYVTFNATKTELLSFNRHRDPLLVPVEMHVIELPEETSFRLLGLTFTPSMDWKPYIYKYIQYIYIYIYYAFLEAIYTVHCQGCLKESGLPL